MAAATRIASSDESAPTDAFYAHAILLNDPMVAKAPIQVAAALARVIKRGWTRIIENPSTLRNPRLYVADIATALANASDTLSAAARVLLAAEPAIGLNLPAAVKEHFRVIAK